MKSDAHINLQKIKKQIAKVLELKKAYLELQEENKYLKLLLNEYEAKYESQKKYIEDLEESIKLHNFATQIECSVEQNKWIDDLLAEIDACLSLLEETDRYEP